MKLSLLLALPVLGLASLTALADDQWETTTSFNMTGMPFQMPPQTHDVCVASGQHADEQGLKSNKDCDVSKIKRSGNTLSFHMECHGHMQMSGDGKITHSGSDSYSGTVTMTGNFGDQGPSTVTVNYDGHKTGTCDASAAADAAATPGMAMGGPNNPYAAMMQRESAMVGAAMDQQCQQQLDKWDLPQAFIGNNAYCKDQASAYCAAVSKALKGANGSSLGQIAKDHPHWQQAGKACGIDTDGMAAQACSTAKASSDWAGVAGSCPDAETIAKANCTGASYSAITTGSYGALCKAYPNDIKVSPTAASTVSNVGSSMMDGVNKLRGLFGH